MVTWSFLDLGVQGWSPHLAYYVGPFSKLSILHWKHMEMKRGLKCTFNHCELWCMISSGPMIWAQCFAPLPPPPPKKKKVKKKNQNQQTSSMSFSSKAESDKVWWMVRLVELVSLSSFKNIAFFYISFFILDSVLQFRVEGHLYGWVKWFIYFVFLESNLEVLITYAKFALDLIF